MMKMDRLFFLVAAVGVSLILGVPSASSAQKGRKIAIGDDPSMKNGSPGLVLVEIADFQCPYCARGARMLGEMYTKFVSTGKVELVFLDLPLEMHPHAFKAAEAAACAGDQEMFWEMHHTLFANQKDLSPDQLAVHAEGVGVDVAAFQKCLDSKQKSGEIRDDIRLVRSLGITGTPAYLLGRRLPDSDKLEILEVIKGLPSSSEELEAKINALLTP